MGIDNATQRYDSQCDSSDQSSVVSHFAVPARFLRTILGPLALESVGVLLRPASDLFRVWQIPIWRFDAEQVTNEEILHAPLTIGASHSVATVGHHQKIKVLARFDERIDKTVGRFRGNVVIHLADDEEKFPLEFGGVVDIRTF